MALVDTLNRTITEASQAWDDSGLLCILTALVVPVVAWLVRKPLANLVFKLLDKGSKPNAAYLSVFLLYL